MFTPGEATGLTTIDLSFPVAIDRPLLVEAETKIDANITIKAGSFEWSDELDQTDEVVFVDTYEEYGAEGKKQRGLRHYVRHKSSRNGDVNDSAINGVRARFELSNEDGEWSVLLEDDRALTGELFDHLLADASTLGLKLPLPTDARIGLPTSVDVVSLTPLLLGGAKNAQGSAKFILEAHDPGTRVSRLAGAATFRGTEVIEDTAVTVELNGNLVIELNAAEQRVTSLEFEGSVKFSGSGEIEVSGEGTVEYALSTTIDDKKVARQQKQKPRFRDRKVRAPRLGIGLILPSHWTVVRGKSDDLRFVRTVDFDKGEAIIELRFLEGDASYQPGLFFDQIYASMKQSNPGIVYEKTSNPFGGEPGRVYYIPKSEDLESGDLVQAEVYTFQGRFLMFRLYAPAPAYRAAYREFVKAKGSMGALVSKRKR